MYQFENLEDHKSTETRQIIITRICALKVYSQPNWQKNIQNWTWLVKKKFKTKKIAETEKQSTVKVDCQPDWHLPLRTRMVHIYSQHCTMYSMKASRWVYNKSTIGNLPFYLSVVIVHCSHVSPGDAVSHRISPKLHKQSDKTTDKTPARSHFWCWRQI